MNANGYYLTMAPFQKWRKKYVGYFENLLSLCVGVGVLA